MWLWDSPKVLLDAEARAGLFAFCACQGIDAIWMQVALERERAADGTPVLQHAAAWRTLLREAHAAGLTVEALEGAPIYALKPHHAEALAVVDAVIAFSRTAPGRDGFDGLHFDIEPHGLYHWRFPEPRERMAAGLVEVALESSKRLRAAGLRFGVALPFWLQVADEQTGEPIGVVTWEKTRQSAAYHLIDRLDYVAIMSYRDRTTGPNGVVAIAGDLLAHAAAPGRARVYLGLETAADSERVWFVTGEARERTLAKMRARGEDPDELEPIDGFRRSIADDGTRLHLGLRVPAAVDLDAPALIGAMRQLAAAYGTPHGADPPARETAAALSLALGTLGQVRRLAGARRRGRSPARTGSAGPASRASASPRRTSPSAGRTPGISAARSPPPGRSSPASPPSPASPCTTTSISGRSSSAATEAASAAAAAAAAATAAARAARASASASASTTSLPTSAARSQVRANACACCAATPARIDGQVSPDSQPRTASSTSHGEPRAIPNTRPRTSSLGAWLPTRRSVASTAAPARRTPVRATWIRARSTNIAAASVPQPTTTAAPATDSAGTGVPASGMATTTAAAPITIAAIGQTIRATRSSGP